jgi:hypothetical protein
MSKDYIKGTKWIELEPLDTEVPFQFEVNVNSTASANDGYIPYGTNIVSVTAIAYNVSCDGTILSTVTSELIDTAPTVANNIITIYLKYPSTTGVGLYKITFKLTLDNAKATTKELDHRRIRALNV